MKIYRAYQFRMYPDKVQQNLINQTLGCTRFVYNHYLAIKQAAHEQERDMNAVINIMGAEIDLSRNS